MLLSSVLHQRLGHYSQWFGTRYELCFSGIPSARPMSPEKIAMNCILKPELNENAISSRNKKELVAPNAV